MSEMADTIHVLHVDDEPDFADMATKFLEREDDRFDTETAASASEGLDRLSEREFDCIISDYDMPERNGIELLEAVREAYPDIPFILYTGKGSEEIASDAISAGVTDYLQKGSGTSQYAVLANRIRNAVENYYAQSELVNREKRLNLFFEQSPLGVIEWDGDFHCVRMNGAAEEILGYAEDDLEGRSWETIVSEPDREKVDEVVSDLVENEGGYHSINENVRKDGARIVCEWHNRVITNEDGVVAVFSQFQDVTDQREQQRRFKAIFNNTYTFAGLIEPDGTLIEVNETALTFGGLDREDVVGKRMWETYWIQSNDEARSTVREAVEQARNGELFRDEIRMRGIDRDAIVDFSVRPITDEGGEVTLLVPEGRDITERKEQERKQEQIVDRVTDAIVEVDADWQFTLLNEQAEELCGMDEEELLGRDFWEVFHEAQDTRFEEEYRQVMETREPTSFVEYFSQLDGWFDIKAYPKSNGGIAFYFVEITDQRERQRELEQTNAILSALFETLPVGVLAEDTDRNVLAVNERMFELFGLPGSPDGVTGADCERLAEQISDMFVDSEGFIERINALVADRESTNNETLVLRDGRTFERCHRVVALPDGTGHLWTYQDATERSEHTDRLKALNERSLDLMTAESRERIAEIGVNAARDILGLSVNAIHLYDEDQSALVPVAATDTISDLIGDPPVFTEGDSIAWRTYKDGKALSLDDIQDDPDIYNPDTPIRSELYLPLGEHGILLAGSPTRDTFGQQDLTLGKILAANIASALDQRTQTEQLRTNERELTRQNDRLGEFASVVSHDLRSPLSVVEGRLELAQEDCDSEHLRAMETAVERMNRIIEDVLWLAREGQNIGTVEPVTIRDAVDAAWYLVADTADQAALHYEGDEPVEATIEADEDRFHQLLENLLRNAIEHGGPDVTVTVGAVDGGFYVEDDGPGIPEDSRGDVFTAGYSTDEDGTGFGLSIVKQVIDAHGWEIRVTEGTGGGARFEITGVGFAE